MRDELMQALAKQDTAIARLTRERDGHAKMITRLQQLNNEMIERAEKAEAELARLTPTEEEKKYARQWINSPLVVAAEKALLRKFVLRETA